MKKEGVKTNLTNEFLQRLRYNNLKNMRLNKKIYDTIGFFKRQIRIRYSAGGNALFFLSARVNQSVNNKRDHKEQGRR